MNFYFTYVSYEKLKKLVFNTRNQIIINIPEIKEKYGFTNNLDETSKHIKNFLILEEINRKFLYATKKKSNIIYIDPEISESSLYMLLKHIEKHWPKFETILLTHEGKNQSVYYFFNRVQFFIEIKKLKVFSEPPAHRYRR